MRYTSKIAHPPEKTPKMGKQMSGQNTFPRKKKQKKQSSSSRNPSTNGLGWWFGFLKSPKTKGIGILRGIPIPIPNHRAPNQQLTMYKRPPSQTTGPHAIKLNPGSPPPRSFEVRHNQKYNVDAQAVVVRQSASASSRHQLLGKRLVKNSGQIIIFHQPRLPWNKGISLN